MSFFIGCRTNPAADLFLNALAAGQFHTEFSGGSGIASLAIICEAYVIFSFEQFFSMAKKQVPPRTATFPVTQSTSIRGTRRMAREKALQVLCACENSGVQWPDIFVHIVSRDFVFDAEELHGRPTKLLTQAEIEEMEADVAIRWDEEEIDFARRLTACSIDMRDFADNLLKKFAINWDLDRIAAIDRVILRMAIAELLNFPEIPAKVTVNEALELAKAYSTDKSNTFINGILDSVLTEFETEGKLLKAGRGLQ